jgi:hypothetical protein
MGPSLLVTTMRGECGDGHPLTGFYYRETRVLSTLRFEINGTHLWLAEAAASSPDRLDFNYVHPEISRPGGGGTGQAGDEGGVDPHGLPDRSLDVQLSLTTHVGGLDVRLVIANRTRTPVSFALGCLVDADFADIQEAIGGRREQTAPVAASSSDGTIAFAYQHPQLSYRCDVRGGSWDQARVIGTRRELRAAVALEPQQTKIFTASVTSQVPGVAVSEAAGRNARNVSAIGGHDSPGSRRRATASSSVSSCGT